MVSFIRASRWLNRSHLEKQNSRETKRREENQQGNKKEAQVVKGNEKEKRKEWYDRDIPMSRKDQKKAKAESSISIPGYASFWQKSSDISHPVCERQKEAFYTGVNRKRERPTETGMTQTRESRAKSFLSSETEKKKGKWE